MRGETVEYPITRIFRSLQGEGHFVGYPMVFVRLAGCSVRDCAIRAECDEAPWKAYGRRSAREVVDAVRELAEPGAIVCVTGGETTDHDLVPLVGALVDARYRVHLETSGVRSTAGMPLEWLTVSPKTRSYVQRSGHVLKIVVRPDWGDSERAWAQVRALDEGTEFFHRYLQPLTVDGTPANLREVVAMLDRQKLPRWALSTQAHRVWGVP